MNYELTEREQDNLDGCLYAAVSREDFYEAQSSINEGADVNSPMYNCLETAIRNGSADMVKLLIKNGVDINQKNFGSTPLCHAIDRRQKEIAVILIDAGVDFTADKNLAMDMACETKNFDLVKKLIERGADTNENFKINIAHAAVDSKESYNLVLNAYDKEAVEKQLNEATVLTIHTGKTDMAIKLIEYSNATDSQLDTYMGEALLYKNKELLHHIIHDTNYRISPQGRKDLFELPRVNSAGEQTITGYVRELIEKKELNEKLTETLKSKPTKTRTMKI